MTKTFKQTAPDQIQTSLLNEDGSVSAGVLIKNGDDWELLNGEVVDLSTEQVEWLDEAIWQAEQDAEQARQSLNTLTVEVDGMVFQANEVSRSRMLSAIKAAETLSLTETNWKMADNTVQTVTLFQLENAHAKAILAVGAALGV